MNLEKKFNIEKYGNSFESINIEAFEQLIKDLSSEKAYVNEGDFAKVYKDLTSMTCYKILRRSDQIRNAKEEADILKEVSELNVLNSGRVPEPFFSIMPMYTSDSTDVFQNGAFAMQYIDGVRLKDILEKKVPPPKNLNPNEIFDKLDVFIDVMHKEKGIFHRDIHPGNIIIEHETGIPYLIDFGNAVRLTKKQQTDGVNPYFLIINNYEFNLQDDFVGLEKTKKELINFLTKK